MSHTPNPPTPTNPQPDIAVEDNKKELPFLFGMAMRFDSMTYEERVNWLREFRSKAVTAAVAEAPQITDNLCYNCGNKIFKYNNAFRCIYCGGYTTAGFNSPEEEDNNV